MGPFNNYVALILMTLEPHPPIVVNNRLNIRRYKMDDRTHPSELYVIIEWPLCMSMKNTGNLALNILNVHN